MSVYDELPIVLVSAANGADAAKIISDIIDNDVTEEMHRERQEARDRVWRIVNKYYSADVRLQPYTDDEPALLPAHNIDAHVVYLTEEECREGAACEARVSRAGPGAQRAQVRLVAAECGAPGRALAASAARLRLELVPLHGGAEGGEEGEQSGAARLREALHAHTWRGLRRTDRGAPPPAYAEEGEWDEAEAEAEGVEGAEAFAAMLGEVRDAREQCAALPPAERARRAEALLAAFCRALGHRLDRDRDGDGDDC